MWLYDSRALWALESTIGALLGGSWDLVSKVISTLIGVISIVTLIITLVTKSHDPLSNNYLYYFAVSLL